VAITLDNSQWRRAITQYAAASGKTYADSENRFIVKLMVGGQGLRGVFQRLPKGDRSRAERHRDNPRLNAWLMRRSGIVGYDRDDAEQFNIKHFNKRRSSVGFIRLFPRQIANAMSGRMSFVGGIASGVKGKSRAFHTTAKAATKRRAVAEAQTSFDYRRNTITAASTSARAAERLLQSALDRAMPGAVRDTVDYVNRKQAKAARKYSA